MNQGITFKKLPGVLAFKRGHVMSDALMFSEMPDGEIPIEVIRHGIRGTQNVNNDQTPAVTNIQETETAKLNTTSTSLVVRFYLAFLPLADSLSSCAGKNKDETNAIRKSIEIFLEKANESEGLSEVARRYARNIANGRWLWRNRTIARSVQIKARVGKSDQLNKMAEFASFDALTIPTNNFDKYNLEEIKLGEEIANQMRGSSFNSLMIEANLTLRTPGAEVFPSQNYIEKKPTGFSRPLYKVGHPELETNVGIRVMGQAAIRDQKVFNAIRTIDTWYPDFAEVKLPIPIEPKGASLEFQEFYREKKASSFDLFSRLNIIDPNDPDGMYCIACFDRGGVYSASDKQEKNNDGDRE